MKKTSKKLISLLLLLCMVLPLLPQVQLVHAADTQATYRYELDTDGIDVGAQYLIVSGKTDGTARALRVDRTQMWSVFDTAVTVKDSAIEAFSGENDCLWTFSNDEIGTVSGNSSYLVIREYTHFDMNPSTMQFTNLGGGAYGIYIGGGSNNNLQHLAYGKIDAQGTYKFYTKYVWGVNGTNSSIYTDKIYLYKRVEVDPGCDVVYDGNGHTSGTLPQSQKVDSGTEYTVEAPSNLRMDIDEDTYLFQCWNTQADGSGTEYQPGEKITVTEDLTLYVQWYQQTKYTVSMITYLDGVATDVYDISGVDKQFYVKEEGGTDEYIPLKRAAEGVYTAKVTKNGTYIVYSKDPGDTTYTAVHGHKVVIYNQDGSTECQHYSVTYDTAGGVWGKNADPGTTVYHANEAVTAVQAVPSKEGNRFMGWVDQHNNLIAAGGSITSAINEKTTLTAQWEQGIRVTVNVEIDHKAPGESGGNDQNADTMHNMVFSLLREENGANLPIEEKILTTGYEYDDTNKITRYTVTFSNMPQGIYNAAGTKTSYEGTIERTGAANENQTINIRMVYAPQNSDLHFNVVVNAENDAEKALMPQAVNVKVTYWGYNASKELGWHTITQQEGSKAPTTIMIDKTNGTGSGYYPVWQYWSEHAGQAYEYRIEVTSFILPDSSIVPATSTDMITYGMEGSGFYTADVSVANNTLGGGRVPAFPVENNTTLTGAYFQDGQQNGVPTLTVNINPYTVKLDAGEGTINNQESIILENQYRYPNLSDYTVVPKDSSKVFVGWCDEKGNPVNYQAGQLLSGNVTLTARYNVNFTLSGEVLVDAAYQQGTETVKIHDIDRAAEILVVLQKQVGDIYNDVDSQLVEITYPEGENVTEGSGTYTFTDIPNDGSQYRIHILTLNYTVQYDNNNDETYSESEAVANLGAENISAAVDAKIAFTPESYQQAMLVDATQIHPALRPTSALVQILYRDLGNVHNYHVISQHTVSPFGTNVEMVGDQGTGIGLYNVWNWHTNGRLYEYQMQIHTLYGNVNGVYNQSYNDSCPYTIQYGSSNNFLTQTQQGGVMLEAKIVPKEYSVNLDLNLGENSKEKVLGLEAYVVDDGSGNISYAYMHTWSYADQFEAYPYREGYVFKGWQSKGSQSDSNEVHFEEGSGHISVGAELANDVTLIAQWEKMNGTDYTVRHLELNTNKVLQGATVVTGATLGSKVAAVDKAVPINGYKYAGALVNDVYLSSTENPTMTITDNPTQNVLVIYYLPDGSDGYTDQVESNLEINKTAVLEDNGTYTVTLDMFTKDNPITTYIKQDTPLDIVLVLDQSGSLQENGTLDDLKEAVNSFLQLVADHGRHNEVDHRVALVGFAGDEDDIPSSTAYPYTGQGVLSSNQPTSWINTGVFDSNGQFHRYNIKGFNYKEYTGSMNANGVYYTKVTEGNEDKYLLLTYHSEYRHLITEEEARTALLQNEKVYGYVYNDQNFGSFVELTRNNSGLWLYGDKQLYSSKEFFTYHTDVWTHRDGVQRRQIHAYGLGNNYKPCDGHVGVYTREETTSEEAQYSIYEDALIPVSIGANGSGGTNPGLLKATQVLGANGATRSSYGMEMANKVLEATPLEEGEERIRLVVMFTDGEPGFRGFDSTNSDYYNQAMEQANNAIAQAYITKNDHNAYVYTIGLYKSGGVDANSEIAYYMNALSSNYLTVQNMSSMFIYETVANGTRLVSDGTFFVKNGEQYYEAKYGYVSNGWYGGSYKWYYTMNGTNYEITTTTNPTVSDGRVNGHEIYKRAGVLKSDNTGYYATTESADQLKSYFENVLQDITTKITTEIVLHDDTILRDYMNQGLVLTEGTVITTYLQQGTYDEAKKEIIWEEKDEKPVLKEVASLELSKPETYEKGKPISQTGEEGVTIHVYNYDSENPTDPTKANYQPHTVDITGYKFNEWYINDEDQNGDGIKEHLTGYKLITTITRIEARDDVEWGRSTNTNGATSGVWLPKDSNGNRELLLPFDQPTTIFVERAYVLDYGKKFVLSDWYFDDERDANGNVTRDANAVHVDCDISNGMNWFDETKPNTSNVKNGSYGNTKYGNVNVQSEKGTVTYEPTTTNWGGYDQFYVFGDTWRTTVLSQDANANGNLWNKVTVIPANNIYYEDSFITQANNTQNGIEGFTFTGAWKVEGNDSGNTEVPEHLETAPYGDVHGWTDSLQDDQTFTDGSAHKIIANGIVEAKAEFTFTGTGVDVYTRTNKDSGLVVAELSQNVEGDWKYVKTLVVDNLAVSGDYYHIPTVSFKDLVYGTYQVKLVAASTSTATGTARSEYYIDGIRVYNPLDSNTNYQPNIVKEAYGLETNAVFTEVRDVLLDYKDFDYGLANKGWTGTGAVFIDWIQEGQENESGPIGEAVPTYGIGTFESYGPKNEVYLSAGQAIVLKVEEGNTYYVGLKSLTGGEVPVNVSGIEKTNNPAVITIKHTTDMYYQINPVDGYIVIQNAATAESTEGDAANELTGPILSITKLRTTNMKDPALKGGIQPIEQQEAIMTMSAFALREKEEIKEIEPEAPGSDVPDTEESPNLADQQATATILFANTLFTSVRDWLETE